MSELSAYWKELNARYSHIPEWTEALTHKSFSPQGGHYEKWELLGDAVLDLAIIDLLIQRYPQLSEGELSKKRAALVNQSHLASLARQLGLEKDIRLGLSELKDQGANKDRILASVVEAILGVVYRTQGWAVVFGVTQSLFARALADKELSLGDYKTELQELTQKIHKSTPEYRLIQGKDSAGHAEAKLPRVFRVQVLLQGRVLAQEEGPSRKQAEQRAARVALEILKERKLSEDFNDV